MKRHNRARRGIASSPKNRESGFTILELLISTAVFSVVLLLCASGIIQVGRMFYKGSIINRTQDTARLVADDVSQAVQFGASANNFYQAGTPTSYTYGSGSVSVRSLCLGSVRYSYTLDRSVGSDTVSQSPHVLWKDHIATDTACTPLNITQSMPTGSSADGIELLGDNMRIPTFTVPSTPSNGLWNIVIVVSYGYADLFVAGSNYSQCISATSGGQFCASSIINTHVVKRL